MSTRSRRKSIKIWFFMTLLIKWFMIEGINCDFWKLNLNFYSAWRGLIMIHVWLALSNLFARKPDDADSLKKIIYRCSLTDWTKLTPWQYFVWKVLYIVFIIYFLHAVASLDLGYENNKRVFHFNRYHIPSIPYWGEGDFVATFEENNTQIYMVYLLSTG